MMRIEHKKIQYFESSECQKININSKIGITDLDYSNTHILLIDLHVEFAVQGGIESGSISPYEGTLYPM